MVIKPQFFLCFPFTFADGDQEAEQRAMGTSIPHTWRPVQVRSRSIHKQTLPCYSLHSEYMFISSCHVCFIFLFRYFRRTIIDRKIISEWQLEPCFFVSILRVPVRIAQLLHPAFQNPRLCAQAHTPV